MILYFVAQSSLNLKQADALGLLGEPIAPLTPMTFHRMEIFNVMKHSLKTPLLLSIALTGSMLIAQAPQRRPHQQQQQPPAEAQTQQDAQQQTVTGKIAKKDNGQYVLVDSAGTLYQLDDQSSAQKFSGQKVKVSGTVDTSSNSIHVTEIKAAS